MFPQICSCTNRLVNEYPRNQQESENEKTPGVKNAGQRFSMNMITAIRYRGDLRLMILEGRFNSDVFIEFMRRLLKGSKQKIILIIDNHSADNSKALKSWGVINGDRIKLFHLPPYSPDLNPDEI